MPERPLLASASGMEGWREWNPIVWLGDALEACDNVAWDCSLCWASHYVWYRSHPTNVGEAPAAVARMCLAMTGRWNASRLGRIVDDATSSIERFGRVFCTKKSSL